MLNHDSISEPLDFKIVQTLGARTSGARCIYLPPPPPPPLQNLQINMNTPSETPATRLAAFITTNKLVANSCWQTQIGVCERRNNMLAICWRKIELTRLYSRQVFPSLLLCLSHTHELLPNTSRPTFVCRGWRPLKMHEKTHWRSRKFSVGQFKKIRR